MLSAAVDAGPPIRRGERLWLRVPGEFAPPRPHADPFVVGLFLPAMAAGQDLIVDGPISPSLIANLSRIQSLLVPRNSENPFADLRRIRVEGFVDEASLASRAATGLFFSGGVDSMYSLVAAEAETGRQADALVFVKGYDVPLDARHRTAAVLHHLAGTAHMAKQRLIVIETNLRRFTDPLLCWDMAHGGGLAAAGHAMRAGFDRWLISASDSHYRGELSGTTTELDPLWSSDKLTFVPVGSRVDRQMKSDEIADQAFAHRHLVVCWKAPPGMTNCGRCAKCLRTMLQFLTVDALQRFETLPHEVSPELISPDTMLAEPWRIVHWQAMVQRLSARPEWAPLADRVRQLIRRSEQIKRFPKPSDFRTREGRLVAIGWLHRSVQRHMPVAIRRRLLPWYRFLTRGPQNTGW